jgi:hypothetical protein
MALLPCLIDVRQEAKSRFGFYDEAGFKKALAMGNLKGAQDWLLFAVCHQECYPDYFQPWSMWLSARLEDLYYASRPTSVPFDRIEFRPQEDAEAELLEKFGLANAIDFHLAIEKGDLDVAQEWLLYIVANKWRFVHLLSRWDNWLMSRWHELAEARQEFK